jgi:hypothetical protein
VLTRIKLGVLSNSGNLDGTSQPERRAVDVSYAGWGAALVAVLVAAGCSSSAKPGPTASSTGSSSSRPSSAPSPPAVPAVATPTVAPAAQAAVNAYIAFSNAEAKAVQDPKHADQTQLRAYLTGAAVAVFIPPIAQMASAGLAYRGAPDNPNLKVVGASPSTVLLSSCPLPDAADPGVEYYVSTGAPVAVGPGPYPVKVITMSLVGGAWKVSNFVSDPGKLCPS